MQTIQGPSTLLKVPSLIQPDGLILNYRANRLLNGSPGNLFFLSSIGKMLDGSNETPLVTVTYFGDAEPVKLPPTFSNMACLATDIGTPFIKEVSFQPATNQKLYFEYGLAGTGSGQQCVLKKVFHHAANSTDTLLVEYSYSVVNGRPELAMRLNGAGVVTEAYSYLTGFSRYAFGSLSGSSYLGLITQKNLDSSFKISSSVGGGLARSSVANGSSATTCSVLGTDACCNLSMPLQTELITRGSAGDGSTGSPQLRSLYYSMAGAYQSTHEMVLYRKEDLYLSGPPPASSPGIEDWIWRDTSGGAACSASKPGVLWAYKNKRDAFTVTPHVLATPGNPPTAIERTGKLMGASDREGAGALESENYTYSYGPNWTQRLSTVTQPSSISGWTALTLLRQIARLPQPAKREVPADEAGDERALGLS